MTGLKYGLHGLYNSLDTVIVDPLYVPNGSAVDSRFYWEVNPQEIKVAPGFPPKEMTGEEVVKTRIQRHRETITSLLRTHRDLLDEFDDLPQRDSLDPLLGLWSSYLELAAPIAHPDHEHVTVEPVGRERLHAACAGSQVDSREPPRQRRPDVAEPRADRVVDRLGLGTLGHHDAGTSSTSECH